MTIVRYRPFSNLLGVPGWMSDLNEDISFPSRNPKSLNVRETEKAIVVEAVIAGVPAKDVSVEIEDGVLTVKAEKKEEIKSKDEYRSSSYQYYYTTALSGGNWKKAEANINDGIVTITIPKIEAVRPRKITVKTTK